MKRRIVEINLQTNSNNKVQHCNNFLFYLILMSDLQKTKILAQPSLCEDMMMCYGIAHNNMIDCKCKQGTIYLAKVLFCN